MQENTNKAIAINSIISYAKMGINTILALLTTRFALQALGVVDFGLFSVLGGIISFISIFNTIMLSTSNRFLAVAVGKGNTADINRQFNINLVIFIGIAIFMFIVAYPIGNWYIHKYINYDGPIENAIIVFLISIIGSIFSTLATPFNGLLIAKEKFIVFSVVEVFSHIVRFAVACILVNHFDNKLIIYTFTMASMTAMPVFVYFLYCRSKYYDYVKWIFVKDVKSYKEVFYFSAWVAYGAVAFIARNQGAALLVNNFFSTVANTALGVANAINAYVLMFANNLTQPMQPQITKSYAAGNYKRTDELLVMSTKFSFLLMLLVSAPFFVSGDFLLKLWLGEVPQYALSFMVLFVIDNIVMSFNSGLSVLLFASGKIALYQIVINTLRLLALVAAFFVLKAGGEPQSLFYTYIVFSIFIVIATQWCLHKTLKFDNSLLLKKSYIPSILVALAFLPMVMIPEICHPLINLFVSIIYLTNLIFFIGLDKKERNFIKSRVSAYVHHK